MQAILFAFLAITSCVYASPRQKRFAGSMAIAGPLGTYAGPFGPYGGGPAQTYSSSMRSGSSSGFGGFGPFFPMPVPMPMPMPMYHPLFPSWGWPDLSDYPVPWQLGPNVCNKTKVFESNNEEMKQALKEMGVSFYSSDGFSMSESKEEMCKGECGNYSCLIRKMTDSGMQTKIITYFCCDGYQLEADPKWGGWKPGCYEKTKEQADSQKMSDKEKEEDIPSESPTTWKNRMKYRYISSSNDERTGVEKVPPQ